MPRRVRHGAMQKNRLYGIQARGQEPSRENVALTAKATRNGEGEHGTCLRMTQRRIFTTLPAYHFLEFPLMAAPASHNAPTDKNFAGQDVRGRNFRNCDLRGADFSHAKLYAHQFDGARLDGAKFCRAQWRIPARFGVCCYKHCLAFSAQSLPARSPLP